MDKYRKEVISFKESTKGQEFYCFDLETTGLSPAEDHIIEFSALKVKESGGEYSIVDSLDLFFNPGIPIPAEIVEITGITDDKVKDAPDTGRAAQIISEFLGEKPDLMGYNSVSFDQNFMNSLYKNYLDREFSFGLHRDVIKMARDKLPKPHKLINVAQNLGISEGVAFHTSIADAAVTLDAFKKLLPMYDEPEKTEDFSKFQITRITRWTKSATLDRIYVSNSLNAAIYYDIPQRIWSVGCNLEDSDVANAVYAYAGVSSDETLVEKYSGGIKVS